LPGRTRTDAARMLTVLAGHDPAESDTVWNVGHVEEDYARDTSMPARSADRPSSSISSAPSLSTGRSITLSAATSTE
jgi:hypothetical protein